MMSKSPVLPKRFAKVVRPQVAEITPYLPGKPVSELQRELGVKQVIKLASNENPLGCSPRATAAIQNHLTEMSRYPDGNAFYLKQALSKMLGVQPENLLIGNGSNEVLELVARAFAAEGDEIIYSQYAFIVYALSAQVVGATGVEVPAKAYGHDLVAMAEAITDKTKVIYLANPNNPTGTLFGRSEWEAFMAQVPDRVMVVLDEAYLEYVEAEDYPNGLDYLAQYPNLLVTRTFSKAYGLAALRVGYLVGDSEVVDYLNRIREPFNVNHLAMVAAESALLDQNFIQKSVEINSLGKRILQAFLDCHHIPYIPSEGNFLTIEVGEYAQAINETLLENGVIVRPIANYGLHNHLRVTIGNSSEMRLLIRILREVFVLFKLIEPVEKSCDAMEDAFVESVQFLEKRLEKEDDLLEKGKESV